MKVITDKKTGGKTLVANRQYSLGSVVYELNGLVVTSPTRTSIEIGLGQHIEDKLGQFVNHSFSPTTEVKEGKLIAIHNIKIGDPITFDYTKTETNISHPFTCGETGKEVV